jgi:hypothetical protein
LLIFLFWLIKKKYESTSSSTDKIKRCFSFILKNEEAILKIIFSVVSVSYVSVLAYYYLYPALVPDEILFYNYFNQINKSIFSNFDIGIIFENRFGYGSFYWLFGGVFNNIIILRIFALL